MNLNRVCKNGIPIVSNPIVTAIIITICIIIIILLVYTGDGIGIGKVAFWSVLAVTSLIFLHDSVIINEHKKVIGRQEQQYVSIPTPPALLGVQPITKPKMKKIVVPTLSVTQGATY